MCTPLDEALIGAMYTIVALMIMMTGMMIWSVRKRRAERRGG